MSHFVSYQDKENSQLGLIGPLGRVPLGGARPKAGPTGKSFQSNAFGRSSLAQRKNLDGNTIAAKNVGSSTRKALGGLNISPTKRSTRPRGTSQDVFLKPPMPASKPKQTTRPKTTAVTAKKCEEQFPEVEHIPVCQEEEDLFDDIWNVSERPDTYISQLLEWRPCRFSPYVDPSQDENNLLPSGDCDDNNSSTGDIRIQDLTVEDPELGAPWEDTAELCKDFTLPPLDDPFNDDDTLAMLK